MCTKTNQIPYEIIRQMFHKHIFLCLVVLNGTIGLVSGTSPHPSFISFFSACVLCYALDLYDLLWGRGVSQSHLFCHLKSYSLKCTVTDFHYQWASYVSVNVTSNDACIEICFHTNGRQMVSHQCVTSDDLSVSMALEGVSHTQGRCAQLKYTKRLE